MSGSLSRRGVLGAASVMAVGLGGCLEASSQATGCNGSASKIRDDPAEHPMTTADLEEFDPARTHRKLALGSREGVPEAYEPHNVGIWNTAGDTPVSVRVLDPGAETVLHDNTYKMPNNSRVAMELLEPAIYLVEVCVPTTGTTLTLRVPCRLFDCNSSRTMVGVFPDGEIRSRVVSTVIGCQGPEC